MRSAILKQAPIFWLASGFLLNGQEPKPRFEVASVKAAGTHEIGGVHNYAGGRIELRGCTFQYLIQVAFHVQAFQIAGGPAWLEADRFDIDAKPPASAKSVASRPSSWKTPLNEEQRQMLQALLEDRFGLKYSKENREGPLYLLVRGKGPLGLEDARDKEAYPWSGGLRGGMITGDGMAGTNESMSDLAWRLSRYLEHPVIDRSGIIGSFDFRIEYRSDEPRPDIVALIFTCTQQMGLKLESARGPVETIVIEHCEKPSAN